MKAQVWCDEREGFVDTLTKGDAWIRRAKGMAGRARRWSLLIEAAHVAAQSGVLLMPFGEVPQVGYDIATMQDLFVFTAADGQLVVVSVKGIEALTLV